MENKVPDNNLDNSSEGTYIRARVLSVPEVAEKLQLTKQRIYALIKAGQLKPAKADNVTLFSVSEIDRFTKARLLKAQPHINNSYYLVYFDHEETSTRKSTASWEIHKHELNCIEEIRIYRYKQDAARDGYFEVGSPFFGILHDYAAPTMVIRAKNGVQLWLLGCNCGYGGEGPQGTVDILLDAQKSGLLRTTLSKEEWEDYVFCETKCIISQADDGTMTCREESEAIRDRDQKLDEAKQYLFSTVQLFARDGHLVLVQSDNPMRSTEAEKAVYLQLYMDYIPNPVSFTCFPTREAAKNNGYYGMTSEGEMKGYQIILVDASGTEIWFESLKDSKISLTKNETIRELFQTLGYELPIDKSSVPTRVLSWINDQVMKSPADQATPLFIRFNK